MELVLCKENGQTIIQENGHAMYTIEEEKEQGLLCVYLKNMYGEEVLGMYQIQKWYTRFIRKHTEDFTIYAKDDKQGEMHGFKEGYEVAWKDVFYRFYGGYHATKKTILCIDKEMQLAEFTMDAKPTVRLRNTSLNAIFALLLYMFDAHLAFDKFEEEAYLYRYKGRYQDAYEFEK